MAEKEGLVSVSGKLHTKLKPNRKVIVFTMCLTLSATAWFAKALTGSFTTQYHIPIAYKNMPFNARLIDELPEEAVFHYQGSGWDLLYLRIRNIPDSIIVDLGKNSSGDGKIRIRALSLVNQMPDDPLPYKIEPEWIAPGIVSETSKKIPVIAELDIRYRNRFGATTAVKAIPDSIQISGPPELIKHIRKIETLRISRQDVFEGLKEEIGLKRSLPPGVLQSHHKVEIQLGVGEFTEGFFMIPVELKGNLAAKTTIIPSKIKVVFQAELSNIGSIQADDFSLTLDTSNFNSGKPLPVVISKKPDVVKHIRLEPERVEYLLKP